MIQTPPSEAAQRIRGLIRHRGLKPGDQLPTHEELSKFLNVGRCRLREGMSILRHQGIVETRNKGGTIVRKPSIETLNEPIRWHLDATGYRVQDLVSSRAWLESGAAAEAAQNRTARDLLNILDHLEQLESLIEADRSDWPEDEAFHLAMMEATHNPVLVTFGQLVRLNFQGEEASRSQPSKWRREFNQQHRAIYNAIEQREAEAARTLMYAHVMGQLSTTGSTTTS